MFIIMQALDGFMMMVSRDGRILYTTDSISQFLGLRQVSIIDTRGLSPLTVIGSHALFTLVSMTLPSR